MQFTPPGSPASIQFGQGTTTMTEPLQRLLLVVEDIEAAREDLIDRGVEVSEIWHTEPGKGPGRASTRSAGRTSAGRPSPTPTATSGCCRRSPSGSRGGCERWTSMLSHSCLHETALHHGAYEAVAPPHDWWDWYAAYMDARETGSTPEEASAAADRYMAEVKHVVVSRA